MSQNVYDNIIKMFKQKHDISEYTSVYHIIEQLFESSNNKEMVDFNELQKKNVPDFAILGNTLKFFDKLFYEGEVIKSLQDTIFPPMINTKTHEQHIMYIKNNKLIINKCTLISSNI